MRTVTRRIAKLEDRLWVGDAQQRSLLFVVAKAGWGLALDMATCAQILRECGFVPTGPIGLVNLCGIPDDLNAEELETFLREEGPGSFASQRPAFPQRPTRWPREPSPSQIYQLSLAWQKFPYREHFKAKAANRQQPLRHLISLAWALPA
jgi:hypothetical protein